MGAEFSTTTAARQDLLPRNPAGRLEVGTDREGQRDERGEHHLVIGHSEGVGEFLLQRALCRGPHGAQPAGTGGEHEAPHRREDGSPGHGLVEHGGAFRAAFDGRDDEGRHTVDVVVQVPQAVRDPFHGTGMGEHRAAGPDRSEAAHLRWISARPKMSTTARRRSRSVTTMKCQRCRLRPVGACVARSTHSSIRDRGTGRSRSRRLRTARVVDSSWSGVRSRVTGASSAAGDCWVRVGLRHVAVAGIAHRPTGTRRLVSRSLVSIRL